ncbi:leucine-rich repeat domain-containing protein [Parachlamydia sp. AcF125]|uniref:leucine-rich repeat domain-containing protein n=1 Tax=Parachlamydia sp. AcF125 TaxID=2795736 RepID=UPI001BC94D0E|nr:leucine-rich repeat domain-containing protein [Parachlamydia sp. AcF125]MBS4169274.1 E3 ubiquitin-protein ligase SspH2 [Parachlamydia sp. AcF125]
MLPPTVTSSNQVSFQATVFENLKDPVSGKLMTRAVTLFPCGHNFNVKTIALKLNGFCPLDGKPIEGHAPNYTIRKLAGLEELKPEPGLEKGKQKISSSPFAKEHYLELLFNLLDEPSIQEDEPLKKTLESQLEELMNQESKELTAKEKESFKWTEKLLGESKKVRQFVARKLQQMQHNSLSITTSFCFLSEPALAGARAKEGQNPSSEPMASLYDGILHFHFPQKEENRGEQASILEKIYNLDPRLSYEAKVTSIFESLFKKAQSLSPLEFEDKNRKKESFTLATYASYLLNINRLLIWQKLPGGAAYLGQAEIKALPLKQKGELFKEWIKEHGKNVSTLDLFNLGLTFLAPEIGLLSNLKALILTQNQLTVLPTTIGQLTRLVVLNLEGNQLRALPPTIGYLSHLKELRAQGNQLTALPDTIGQLTQLEAADLTRNQLVALPPTIGRLSKLMWLCLGQNQLMALPASIGQLTQLKWLKLGKNQLTGLPATIGQLTQLQILDLEENQLTALPTTIGQLTQLQILELGENQLTALPTTIGELSKLEWLYLTQNELAILPVTIGQLTQLKGLSLCANPLTVLPVTIGQLNQLKTLNLEKNQLKALPTTIGQLTQLEWLNLRENQLAALPIAIRQLTQLKSLNLWGNQLRALPVEIKKLQQLGAWIDLGGNPLQSAC